MTFEDNKLAACLVSKYKIIQKHPNYISPECSALWFTCQQVHMTFAVELQLQVTVVGSHRDLFWAES